MRGRVEDSSAVCWLVGWGGVGVRLWLWLFKLSVLLVLHPKFEKMETTFTHDESGKAPSRLARVTASADPGDRSAGRRVGSGVICSDQKAMWALAFTCVHGLGAPMGGVLDPYGVESLLQRHSHLGLVMVLLSIWTLVSCPSEFLNSNTTKQQLSQKDRAMLERATPSL